MKQGFYLQSASPVQHMMSTNPNYWWNNINPPPPRSPFCHSSSSSPNLFLQYPPTSSFSSLDQEQLPESLSQLLMGGLVGEEDKSSGMMNCFQEKRVGDWVEQQVLQRSPNDASALANHHHHHHHVKQEDSARSYSMYGRATSDHHALQGATNKSAWSHHHHHAMIPGSPPKPCVTTSFSSSMLDFSNKKPVNKRQTQPDLSSECNSNATGGAQKKAKVQPSSTSQSSTFKVRKEKLGDRISALHQLVSPFGKTDTASVLLEAIGYIRFLQNQIEALSSAYMGRASGKVRHDQSVRGERSSMFSEDSGQALLQFVELPTRNAVLHNHFKDLQWITEIYSAAIQQSPVPKDSSGFVEMPQKEPSFVSIDHTEKAKRPPCMALVNKKECCLCIDFFHRRWESINEEPKNDLRSRGLCLVPVSCTLQVGSDNGADYWASAFGGGLG